MAITDLLSVSRLGIFASQGMLQTISHNISNVNTPGFSRQSSALEAVPGAGSSSGGAGVHIAEVTRQYDRLVDRRLEFGTGELGRLQSRDRFLTLIEETFNDMDGDGFSQRLDAFYAAADNLADNPTNPVGREDLVARADTLAGFIQRMHNGLSELTLPVDQEINVMVADINNRLENLQEINSTIVRNNVTNPALDLIDQRRTMILELGDLIDISTLEMPQNGLQISTSGGQELLANSNFSVTIDRSPTVTETGFLGLSIDGRDLDISKVKGGQLKGLVEVRDEIIHGDDGFLTRLDVIADEIRFQVNRVQSQSVSQRMYTTQTGAFDLGSDLANVGGMAAMQTDITQEDYLRSPVDVNRVVAGTIIFAGGVNADNLTTMPPSDTDPSDTVEINPGMSIEEVRQAIDDSVAVNATIVDNRLVVSAATPEGVYGVVSDSSGVLAALGIGALFGGTGARNMAVNQEIMDDSRLLGIGRINVDNIAAPTQVSFDDGNNEGALALGVLRTSQVNLFNQDSTLIGHYATTAGILGSVINQNTDALTAQRSSQDFISQVRESISGVSLEEELTDLVRFQRAFQASSKMINVADELMQTIIGMV